jgi:Mg-chelatase subunit ChlI
MSEFDLDGYRPLPVVYELRQSILERIKDGREILPEIDGREETKEDVIRAILSGANPYLVSAEGTGKTRLARSLTSLLHSIPAIKGCPYHDDPGWGADKLCPRCVESEDPMEEYGIEIVPPEKRFSRIQGNEYTNYAKVLGLKDIQAIREGKSPTDPRAFTGTGVFHANRGILFVDELPSIPTNIQSLFHSILEEKKVILEEYNLEQPVDLIIIATGNPEGFAHVNRIPSSILDGLELIHMDIPKEDVEKEIMIKEAFKFDLSDYYAVHRDEIRRSRYLRLDRGLLERTAIMPWWISYIVSKTIEYTRLCQNLDRGTGICGAKKAIDHAYASVEMDGRRVANLKDARDGLCLALRGRIRIRSDLIDLRDPKGSFERTDMIVEDMLRHATRSIGDDLFEVFSKFLDLKELGEEMDSVLSGSDWGQELNRAINWICDVAPEKVNDSLLNDLEYRLYHHMESDQSILEEYRRSGLEILINEGINRGMIDEYIAVRHFFIPQVFQL